MKDFKLSTKGKQRLRDFITKYLLDHGHDGTDDHARIILKPFTTQPMFEFYKKEVKR